MADTSASGGRRQSAETLGKHGGRQVARARMASLAAVKNPGAFLDGGLRPGPGSEPPVMDQSVPETAPEALHRRVAVTVILARHRRPQPELRHQSPVIVGTVPAAQAGVMDPPRGRAFKPHGPHQSQSRRLLRPPFAHGMAGDFAGEHVLDACQAEPALTCGDAGQIRYPHLVRSRGGELLAGQVPGHRQVMAGVRGRLEPALLPAAQAHPATQAADAITTGHKAPGSQFRLQTPVTAGLTAAPVRGPDGHLQPFVFLCTGRWPAGGPIVKAAARDPEQPAHHLNRKPLSPCLHERVPCSGSLAKYAVAFFRISLSSRVRSSSLRRRTISASSSGTGRAPGVETPLPLAAATQLPSVPFGIAKRFAAASCDSLCSRTSLTASARNSGE